MGSLKDIGGRAAFRRAAYGGTALALLTLSLPAALAAEAGGITITEGRLGPALVAFADQTRLQVLYTDPAIAQTATTGARAAATPQTALDALLRGTDLRYEFTNENTVRIFAADERRSGLAPNASLASTQVAQAAAAPTAETASRGLGIEEIIVTSRKREENLQRVPLSISAFTARTIQDAGMADIKDVADFTPNFSFRESFGRTFDRPVLRGMSNILGNPNTGIFIDGAFVSGSISSVDLQNVERVEVIKGPQAALYGRATFAGAVNYITKQPSNEFEGKVTGTIAEHDQYEAFGSVSGPLIRDVLAAYVSARYYTYGGEYENVGTGGGKPGAEESYSVNAAFRLTPADGLDATLRVSYAKDNDDHIAFHLQNATRNNCFFNAPRNYFCGVVDVPETVALNLETLPDPGLERRTFRSNLNIGYTFANGYELRTQFAFTDEDTDTQRDNDFRDTRTNPFFPRVVQIESFRTWDKGFFRDYSGEVRLSSPTDNAFRWLVGGYYYKEKVRTKTSGGAAIGRFTRGTPDDTRNLAAFGSVEYDILDTLTATAEVRAAWDRKSTQTISTAGGVLRTADLSETFDSVTPRFTLNYSVSDSTILYASLSKGNKPGGFNTGLQDANISDAERARLAEFDTFEEERSWNYEIGAKTSLLDDRLIFNVSGFYIDWSKQQLSTSAAVVRTGQPFSTVPLIVNAGKTEVKGLEIQLSAQPTDWLTVQAGYGLADAKFKEYDDPEQLQLFGNASAKGFRTPNAPKHTFNASATVRVPLSDSIEGFWRTDVLYESTRYDQIHNLAETGDSTKVNMRLGVETGGLQVALFAKNLFNDRTANSVTRFLEPDRLFARRAFGVALPRGRQIGLTATYDF
jgi:outer membrane receptor protein involved in Fe transport